jgi:hypothetical protein
MRYDTTPNPGHPPGFLIDLASRPSAGQIDEKSAKSVGNLVRVLIADLLGKDGHKVCTGWQLEPLAGNMDAARSHRRAWRTALAEGRQPDVPEPKTRPVSKQTTLNHCRGSPNAKIT